jgi:hypothetical protein
VSNLALLGAAVRDQLPKAVPGFGDVRYFALGEMGKGVMDHTVIGDHPINQLFCFSNGGPTSAPLSR